jgi:hypothetical protein
VYIFAVNHFAMHVLRCSLCILNIWSQNRPSNHCTGITVLRAPELVPILAEQFDIPFEVAYRIDRALAEAGLRAKGKGRSLPDVSRREALTFLIACMVTAKLTKAAEETLPWISALGVIDPAPELEFDTEWGEYEEEGDIHHFYNAMEKVLASRKTPEGAVTLLDFLFELCGLIEVGLVHPGGVEVMISFTDMSVAVTCENDQETEFAHNQFFVTPTETKPKSNLSKPTSGIKRKCSVNGDALRQIIDRT